MNIILYILTQDLQSLTASRYVLESIPELKEGMIGCCSTGATELFQHQ